MKTCTYPAMLFIHLAIQVSNSPCRPVPVHQLHGSHDVPAASTSEKLGMHSSTQVHDNSSSETDSKTIHQEKAQEVYWSRETPVIDTEPYYLQEKADEHDMRAQQLNAHAFKSAGSTALLGLKSSGKHILKTGLSLLTVHPLDASEHFVKAMVKLPLGVANSPVAYKHSKKEAKKEKELAVKARADLEKLKSTGKAHRRGEKVKGKDTGKPIHFGPQDLLDSASLTSIERRHKQDAIYAALQTQKHEFDFQDRSGQNSKVHRFMRNTDTSFFKSTPAPIDPALDFSYMPKPQRSSGWDCFGGMGGGGSGIGPSGLAFSAGYAAGQ